LIFAGSVNKYHSYINTAVSIVSTYSGETPLHVHLKKYFSVHKKHGSRDRKSITHICYCYYRIGKVLKEEPVKQRLLISIFLCEETPGVWKDLFEPAWLCNWYCLLQDRISFVKEQYPSFDRNAIFPHIEEVSKDIDREAFLFSHLIQPNLFIRIRPGNENGVFQKLYDNGIFFEKLTEHCLALPNATKIDSILEIDKEAVIQDYSSQRIGAFVELARPISSATTSFWDCCAASGGKSILAKDILGDISLTVSDIRVSILQNLKKRFERAGITDYQSFIVDLSAKNAQFPVPEFTLILCDVPCSGSGTWGRTPEQLFYFPESRINYYSSLQQKIITHSLPKLAPGGYFLYTTCSVFKQENEDMVDFILQKYPSLKLIRKETLIGYQLRADSMFAALFAKR
jgi:16S rRNA (cytosine967-C5)-methyltransferase